MRKTVEKQIFGSTNMAVEFGRYRRALKKNKNQPMTRKKILELADKGKESLKSGTVRNDSYSDDLMEEANARE